ncbi:MAG TPA: sugar ABC transporter ATP-binding protein [Spirochaetia bacterium]
MNGSETVLELRGIRKDYPGIHVLCGVDLEFRKGEIHGLIGENGAGKSTLIKILAGVVHADGGSVRVRGVDAPIHSSRDARHRGLSFIHQELNLIEYQAAPENIFLGHPYPRTTVGTVSWRKLRARASEILSRLGASVPLNVPVAKLTTVQRSMVAIARAFAESASIFFMDEPTTSLSDVEKASLFSVIRALKETGATIVYVSHALAEILSLTDRVSVMRDGRVIGTVETARTDRAQLISMMTGRDMNALFPPRKSSPGDAEVLSVSSLSGRGISDITFTVRSGEVLGIAGLVGAGRTELLRTIFGASPAAGGSMSLGGQPFRPRSPAASIRRGVACVPEERRSQGLVLGRSVVENISLVHLRSLSRGVFLDRGRARAVSRELGDAVRLKTTSYSDPVATLSGGNQQKVVIAKYMVGKPRLFMLDEPTRGVDVGTRYEIYSVIRELAAGGSGIILASSDFSELIGLSDRILVLHEGRQLAVVDNAGLDEEKLLTLCYGRNQS